MNIEFHAGDALAFLSSKMEMVILDLQLAELPFKRRGSYAQIGERAHHHIAADPGEAIEVKNRHQGYYPKPSRTQALLSGAGIRGLG
jgi:hypothetical protein